MYGLDVILLESQRLTQRRSRLGTMIRSLRTALLTLTLGVTSAGNPSVRGWPQGSRASQKIARVRTRKLVWWLSLLLTGGSAVGERGDLQFGPREWPRLLQIARQVPGFAGPTSNRSGGATALVDPSQTSLLKKYLNRNPDGTPSYGMKSSSPLNIVKAQYSVVQLIATAQAMLNLRPAANPRVDTMLNRVVLDRSVSEIDAAVLAQTVDATGQVISARERPRLHASVLPSTLILKVLRALPGGLPYLTVKLVNTMNRPAMYVYGCGAEVDLEALNMNGEKVAGVNYGCTLEGKPGLVLQPGESRILHTFPHADLRRLPPGQYCWHVLVTDERIPLTLTP